MARLAKRAKYLKAQSPTLTHRQGLQAKRVNTKATGGRGRKRSALVQWLYPKLYEEFLRLRKLAIKLSRLLLREAAGHLIRNPPDDEEDGEKDDTYEPFDSSFDPNKITPRWIQTFCEKHGIVGRAQCGKKSLSAAKMESIHRNVAYHLGVLKREFDSGLLDEDSVANMDETHFGQDEDNSDQDEGKSAVV